MHLNCKIVVILSLSHVRVLVTPWTAAHQASLYITNSWSLLKLMSIKLLMPSSHLILCRPLLFLPLLFPSIRVFSNESALPIRWPKYWTFIFSISPSNEHSGLIFFRMDWLDLLAVQGTLKSLLQHHTSKASILRHSAFFIVQLSHAYVTTGETIALCRRTYDYRDPWRQGLNDKRVPEGMLKGCSAWGQQRPEWSLEGVWARSPGAGQGERFPVWFWPPCKPSGGLQAEC